MLHLPRLAYQLLAHLPLIFHSPPLLCPFYRVYLTTPHDFLPLNPTLKYCLSFTVSTPPYPVISYSIPSSILLLHLFHSPRFAFLPTFPSHQTNLPHLPHLPHLLCLYFLRHLPPPPPQLVSPCSVLECHAPYNNPHPRHLSTDLEHLNMAICTEHSPPPYS
ncbi:hypothetical protein Pmani_033538 [Petrolisthes manimaculis]|uniref:Uncharacterized protein n=1 Tax=Petrolisthes manimaculis TaxID=1843537 RepID=A0AAE1TQA8_9EUCA|nr:hypothetical protein Pmani_033538 [Petrolisthes manimaculis]